MSGRNIGQRLLRHYSFQHLLVWMLVYIVAGPFIEHLPYARIILSSFISLVLLLAVYTVNRRNKLFKYLIALLVITLILFWMEIFKIVSFPRLVSRVLMAVYILMLVYAFTKYVYSAKRVDSRLISAALCLYLMIGTMWGVIFNIVELISPGSFKGALLSTSAAYTDPLQEFQYLSFVTLTTLGYGDILPQTQGAAALCQAEAIIGQFYMTVLVARLVGIQVSQKFVPDPDQDQGRDM